ncbi:peptidoglycan DD-metalloendopeptidase family protein [Brasilonema sp. UFV-L1]|uniref:murein hydrolase activator EnvC family protein n=1 Tax=Brasilonema sp. UFV-L1 TaxID=2234130 RepID=UPI00145F3737|nr:peptidoglycan DD-metalloendopeptidase family protein [Brasilonema sp. UFV-L1]NMG07482.1 peptidase M23 [Brasilonema sp. UFV-L1]
MRTLLQKNKGNFSSFILVFFYTLCINLTLTSISPVYAVVSGKSNSLKVLRQKQWVINQKRQDIAQKHHRLSNLQQAAQQRFNSIKRNLNTTDTQIQDSQTQLQLATQRQKQLQANVAASEVSYQQRQQGTIARLRFLQRSRLSQGWTILLQSQDLTDFLDRRHQLKLVYQADQQILEQLATQVKYINQQKTAIEYQKNEIDLILSQLLAQKADYQAQAELQAKIIQRLGSDRRALQASLTQQQKDSKALQVLIQQKVAKVEAPQKMQIKAFSSNSIILRGTHLFAYPSNASTSSTFGWRMHPIVGERRFHAGLDFAADYGSTIRAAGTGTIIFAGWYGGYGKAVIIHHGNGMTTLYGHTSELYVSEGQQVKRGQPVAAVGSTGLSTGPHLHFEVRRNGTPVDPMNYL